MKLMEENQAPPLNNNATRRTVKPTKFSGCVHAALITNFKAPRYVYKEQNMKFRRGDLEGVGARWGVWCEVAVSTETLVSVSPGTSA